MVTTNFPDGITSYGLPVETEMVVSRAAATLVNGTTIFTITGGPIRVTDLVAVCVTANGAALTTLQYSCDPVNGAPATFTGASASLASAAAGASVALNGTALTTAPDVTASGPSLGPVAARQGIYIPEGIITTVVGAGPSTGTWSHHMRYVPLAPGVAVS